MIIIADGLKENLILTLKDSAKVIAHLDKLKGQSDNLSFDGATDQIEDMLHDNFNDHEEILGCAALAREVPETLFNVMDKISTILKKLETRHEKIAATIEAIKDQAEKIEELLCADLDLEYPASLTAEECIDFLEWSAVGVAKV